MDLKDVLFFYSCAGLFVNDDGKMIRFPHTKLLAQNTGPSPSPAPTVAPRPSSLLSGVLSAFLDDFFDFFISEDFKHLFVKVTHGCPSG